MMVLKLLLYFILFMECIHVPIFVVAHLSQFFKNTRLGKCVIFPKKAQFHSSHKKNTVIFVFITKSDRRPTDVFGSGRAPRDISIKQVCSHDVTAIDRSTNHKHIQ